MAQPLKAQCGHVHCRAYRLSIDEFARIGGERWTHGFRVKLGLRARALYLDARHSKKSLKKGRSKAGNRNPTNLYPCGILEQAYRDLIASEGALPAQASPQRRHDQYPSD